jgi:hypothetical protein
VSFATVSITSPRLKASEVFLPFGKSGEKISLLDLSTIKIKEVEQIRGDKMSFKDRVGFKIAQKKLRDNIAPDGSLDTKAIQKAFKKQQKSGDGGFHFGGFALGFFLGPIGVLITYIINDDYNRSRRWSAWKGFLAAIILATAIVAATSVGY